MASTTQNRHARSLPIWPRVGFFLCLTLSLIATNNQFGEIYTSTSNILPWNDEPSLAGTVLGKEAISQKDSLGHCQNVQEKKFPKVVFVHVYKTAGSTLRTFFARYARRCGVGWAEIQCTTVDTASIGSGPFWKAQAQGQPCGLRKLVRRDGTFRQMNRPTKVRNHLLQEDIDIIGGHIPLGVGKVWPHDTNVVTRNGRNEHDSSHGVRYVTFFRNALQKYLSGVSYKAKDSRKVTEQIQSVADRSWNRSGHHAKYEAYLITPEQRQIRQQLGKNVSKQEDALQIMRNLIHFDVTVGITERMSQSMAIIHRLFDANEGVTGLFERYGLESLEKNTNTNLSEVRLNPSHVSASSLWKSLQNDSDIALKLLEFVKYEQQITDFALALHIRQHRSLVNQQ